MGVCMLVFIASAFDAVGSQRLSIIVCSSGTTWCLLYGSKLVGIGGCVVALPVTNLSDKHVTLYGSHSFAASVKKLGKLIDKQIR